MTAIVTILGTHGPQQFLATSNPDEAVEMTNDAIPWLTSFIYLCKLAGDRLTDVVSMGPVENGWGIGIDYPSNPSATTTRMPDDIDSDAVHRACFKAYIDQGFRVLLLHDYAGMFQYQKFHALVESQIRANSFSARMAQLLAGQRIWRIREYRRQQAIATLGQLHCHLRVRPIAKACKFQRHRIAFTKL
jgi:hypothetical protein